MALPVAMAMCLPAFAPAVPRAGAPVMALSGSYQRYAEIESLADQVWQLRMDGLDIHETVVRSLEADM